MDTIFAEVGRQCDVVDPFVGSGTILTEALVRGADFTGVDINPLAVLICQAKAAIDEGADVEGACSMVVRLLRNDFDDTVAVDFLHRDKWFDQPSLVFLSRLRRAISRVQAEGARKVMWTIMAETVRTCSNSRTSTYKLHVRPPEDREAGSRIQAVFERNVLDALRRISEYRQLVSKSQRQSRPASKIVFGDARKVDAIHNSGKHGILVTSPPYGDNHTTIPYGQFSYLALQWIAAGDLPDGCGHLLSTTHTIDTSSLGGSKKAACSKADDMRGLSPYFDAFMSESVRVGKESCAKMVGSFMMDFREALAHFRSVWDGDAHWVVTTGNRRTGGMSVPLDGISADIVRSLGGKHVATLHRPLPRKRMPTRNCLGSTITSETTLVAEFA